MSRKLHRPVHPLSSAAIQRATPGLSLDEAQFEVAIEHRNARWLSLEGKPRGSQPHGTTLEGSPAPAHHAPVSLEGPQAADRRRPHIATHGLSIEGPPLRSALEHRYRLEGSAQNLIRREGLGPALIHHRSK